MIQHLSDKFQTIFHTQQNPRVFFAPGRINLIGEHTDYNGGHVFPAAISFGTYALGHKRADRKLRFYSLNFPDSGIMECSLDELTYQERDEWANFPKGVINYVREAGASITEGMDILFYGNIPNGAGLSSSASIEMVTGVLVDHLFSLALDRMELINIGQQVENQYIGVQSGIMDQFAIGKGKQDYAIHLNTQTRAYQYAPLPMANHVILIINTNKQRTLAGSQYNERRAQCDQALADLQTELVIASLGDLTNEQFEKHRHLITSEVNQKRAKHAVYENQRTMEALERLENTDLIGFGKLMNESHLSLQQDYEVTGIELDTIVTAAWEQDGVVGARMTGAGFGGCAIAIVEKDKVESFKTHVNQAYHTAIGYDATFYVAQIGDGAREITKGVL